MKKTILSKNELEFIRSREAIVDDIIGQLTKVAKFKKGDFLIAFRPATAYSKRQQITNSYNAPKKFVVIYTDKHNIPYMKELSKHGMPTGSVVTPIHFDDYNSILKDLDYEFEVDPDYADSIIMMDEENYDGAAIHRMKSDTFREITDYNKIHKIKCDDQKNLAQWFNANVKVGTILHRSIITSYIVQDIIPIPKDVAGRFRYDLVFMTVLTNKGKTIKMCINDFKWSALYDAQPRSYNELKDPK